MNKKVLFGSIGVIALLLIAGISFFTIRGSKGNQQNSEFEKQRSNMLAIIERYYDRGEYDRALNQIEELLIHNIDDKEALALQDKILDAKQNKENDKEQASLDREQREKDRLLSTVNTAIERKDDKPVIIRRDTPTENENPNEKTDKKELERRKKINQLIDEGFNEFNNQNYVRAKDQFKKALDIEQDNAEANAALAASLFDENPEDNKNIEEAVSRAQKALKKDANNELAHLTLAKIYAKRGMKDQAIEEYTQAVKINPNNYDAFYNLGRLYFMNKQYTQAENSFKSAVNIKKDFVNGYFFLGLTQYRLDNKKGSIQSYKTAIKLDPKFYEAYVNLGEIYRLDSDYSGAIDNYTKAAAINNKYTIQKKIGDAYEAQKMYNKSFDSYMLAVSLNPLETDKDKAGAIECYVSIANLFNVQGKYSDSLSYVQKGLEISANDANLNFMGGFASDKLGDSSTAEQYYQKAISANPGYTQAYINLSSIYNSTNKYEDSINILNRGIAKDSSNYMLFNNLGDAQQKLTQYKEAIESYKKAISINSQEAAVYFNMGLCYKSLNSHDNAIIILKKCIEINANYYDAYYELGESLFIAESFKEAKTIFNTLIAKQPNYINKTKIDSMISVIPE